MAQLNPKALVKLLDSFPASQRLQGLPLRRVISHKRVPC